MKFSLFLLTICLTVPAVAQPMALREDAQEVLLDRYRQAAIDRWENDIAKLEARDRTEQDPVDAILFMGSSSIRIWDTIATDMAPYHPIQRGYGGARFSDVAVFARRLIRPHQYRALVLFVGNDVTGATDDHTPDEIEALVRYIIQVSHDHQPDAAVLVVEVTPTESRFAAWDKIRVANARLREITLSTPNTYFVPTAGHYLRPLGTPRADLFRSDRLHLNRAGYDLWGSLIRRRLDEVLRLIEASKATSATSAK
jgi:hypothetical protein